MILGLSTLNGMFVEFFRQWMSLGHAANVNTISQYLAPPQLCPNLYQSHASAIDKMDT